MVYVYCHEQKEFFTVIWGYLNRNVTVTSFDSGYWGGIFALLFVCALQNETSLVG